MAQQFSTNIFECCKDCDITLVTCCCPCYQMAQNKANVDGRNCNMIDFLCIDCCPNCAVEYFTRVQIRSKYGIQHDPCNDCICFLCCPLCVICQDGREIKFRESVNANRPAGQVMR